MADTNQNVTIEGFVTDLAFDDRTRNISSVFAADTGQVAALTSKVLSYFTDPALFRDKRLPADRSVNWVAKTSPQVVIDKTAFGTFTTVLNNLTGSAPAALFKIIDKLFFNYQPSVNAAAVEAFLTTDADTKLIYVAGSFSRSSNRVTDSVYLDNQTTASVNVPAYIDFKVSLPTGSINTIYVLRLYTSVDAWITGYSISNIVKVIPPLDYTQLYNASLTGTTDSIFSTSSLTATLSYNSALPVVGTTPLSGITEYKAIRTDGVNKIPITFNILYKGRSPTLFEIRNAIKKAFADSGVGSAEGWQERFPGIFVTGRFYIVPLWDFTKQKADQIIYPNIIAYDEYKKAAEKILASLGYGEFTRLMDVFSLFYNRMSAIAIPDLSGTIDISRLKTLIPDYQDCSPSDEQFNYMADNSQLFARELNNIMAVASGVQNSLVYTPIVEGPLKFYSFAVESYEICVIDKESYTTIMESTQ